MSSKILIDPFPVNSGHIKIELEISSKKVTGAKISVPLYRGFERLILRRDFRDAPFVMARICSDCSSAHQIAAANAVENALRIEIPEAAIVARSILLGLDFIKSHLNSFYRRAIFDYINPKLVLSYRGKDTRLLELKDKIAKLFEGNDFYAFSVRATDRNVIDDAEIALQFLSSSFEASKILSKVAIAGALLGGRHPHYQTVVPGGVTFLPKTKDLEKLLMLLFEISRFVKISFAPQVLALAAGPLIFDARQGTGSSYPRFLSAGVFENFDGISPIPSGALKDLENFEFEKFEPEKITETNLYSFVNNDGAIKRVQERKEAYSYSRTPVYKGEIYEVGPLARMLITHDKTLIKLIKEKEAKPSYPLRLAAGALEAVYFADQLPYLADKLIELSLSGRPTIHNKNAFIVRKSAEGFSAIDSPHGIVVHRLKIKEGKIINYQVVSGSTWLLSSALDNKNAGLIENSLIGISCEGKYMLQVSRIINSFNPSALCSSH